MKDLKELENKAVYEIDYNAKGIPENVIPVLDTFIEGKCQKFIGITVREGAQRAGNFLPPFQISRFFQESPTMLSIESVLTLLLIKQDSSL